ncbi:MAG TPA: sugar ABC transporter ATP-binding protein [Solirubrobacteraceae bacterium]|nr:sugar ABC transporter ATP-binding protein [Solirubrobacteraceae bacterium]
MARQAATPEPPPRPAAPDATPLVRLERVSKRYGRTRALAGADLEVNAGEVLGLVGHNGAGKSTLMRVLVGITKPDEGQMKIEDRHVDDLSPEGARAAGIRIVFQELSLSPDLRVFENVVVGAEIPRGWRWRPRSRRLIMAQLDEIFPGHGISAWARIETLSLAQRQMIEIAQATLREGNTRLVILDEPTSALGRGASESLFAFMDSERRRGVSFIFISHRIAEILGHTDRVAVMRDGKVVATRPSDTLTEDDLVTLMGGSVGPAETRAARRARSSETVLAVDALSTGRLRQVSLTLGRGEIVGLAGLEGQGQRELLLELWHRRFRRGRRGLRGAGRMAFVTGDRQESGVFGLWPLKLNISIGALSQVSRAGVIDLASERRLTAEWLQRLKVRGTAQTGILELSGGNQQKVLIARALAAGADLILLDDPFRGVDIGTRQDTYRLIRSEAAEHGRCFLWFSTENLELEQCDRVYVLAEGAIVAELSGEELSEEQIIAASFTRARGRNGSAAAAVEPSP